MIIPVQTELRNPVEFPMDIANLCHFLLGTNQLNQIEVEENKISLTVESTADKATCPKCGKESMSVHSSYMRYSSGLAWADRGL